MQISLDLSSIISMFISIYFASMGLFTSVITLLIQCVLVLFTLFFVSAYTKCTFVFLYIYLMFYRLSKCVWQSTSQRIAGTAR